MADLNEPREESVQITPSPRTEDAAAKRPPAPIRPPAIPSSIPLAPSAGSKPPVPPPAPVPKSVAPPLKAASALPGTVPVSRSPQVGAREGDGPRCPAGGFSDESDSEAASHPDPERAAGRRHSPRTSDLSCQSAEAGVNRGGSDAVLLGSARRFRVAPVYSTLDLFLLGKSWKIPQP